MSDTKNCSRCRFDVDDNRWHNATINIQKSIHSLSIQIRIPIANVSVQGALRKKFQSKPEPKMKKLIPVNYLSLFTNTLKKSRSVSNFLHLRLNIIWAPGPGLLWISKNSSFFLAFMCQKLVYTIRRNPHKQLQYCAASKAFKGQQLR